MLLSEIEKDSKKKENLELFFEKSRYSNMNELMDKVIYENKPSAIIVIDEATDELSNVMAQLTMSTAVIEIQTYISGNKKLYRFSPFKGEVMTDLSSDIDADELDTIVVPAREDGFREEFIKNNCWFAIRISGAMVDKIKYIVHFREGTLRKIKKISLGKKKGLAPQAPRYSSYKTIMKAETLDDLWE